MILEIDYTYQSPGNIYVPSSIWGDVCLIPEVCRSWDYHNIEDFINSDEFPFGGMFYQIVPIIEQSQICMIHIYKLGDPNRKYIVDFNTIELMKKSNIPEIYPSLFLLITKFNRDYKLSNIL